MSVNEWAKSPEFMDIILRVFRFTADIPVRSQPRIGPLMQRKGKIGINRTGLAKRETLALNPRYYSD
jgi:hypothetical protein